jgi:hypothetical protein
MVCLRFVHYTHANNNVQDEIESASVNREVLNTAFQKALELNLPEIVRLLVDKGANKSSIDMKALYELPEVAYLMERLLPYSQNVGNIFFLLL